MKTKKKNSILSILLLVLFGGILVFSVYNIYHLMHDHSTNQKEVQNLQDEIILNKEVVQKLEENPNEEENSSYELELDFAKLKKINSDTVGWIEIRNTHINYPIVQASDNNYYLNHTFYHGNNGDGWIFLSYINQRNLSDPNNIIFGHDTHGSGMFSDLKKLYNGLLGSYIPVTIYTEGETYHYVTFSIFLTEENDNQFLKNRLYESDLKSALQKSKYDFKVDVSTEDSILTLSTCYNSSSHKVILLAKRV